MFPLAGESAHAATPVTLKRERGTRLALYNLGMQLFVIRSILMFQSSLGMVLRRGAIALCCAILSLTLWIAPSHATTVYDLPSPVESSGVIDSADVLSRLSVGKLNKALQALTESTGQQVHLVTIERLEYDDTIAAFTDRLFERWFPTPDTQANQTVVVLATLTNQGGIHTTAGEALPAEIATSIAEDTLLAPLRQGGGKYNKALIDAGDRLVAVLSGQPDPGAPEVGGVDVEATFASAEETDDRNATVWVVVLLIVATVVPMVTYFVYVGLPGR